MRPAPLVMCVVLIVTALSGCFSGDDRAPPHEPGTDEPFAELVAPGADVMDGTDTRSFVWRSSTNVSVKPAAAEVAPQPTFRFPVRSDVGFATVLVEHEDADQVLMTVVRDSAGRKACAILVPAPGKNCTAAVPSRTQGREAFSVLVTYDPEDLAVRTRTTPVPFTLNVTLHPPSHVRLGNITDALDPRFAFENSYTGYAGFEPTLGVNGDGTIFALQRTTTVRSRDDGKTWEDVTDAFSGTIQQTLDPMMYVDPWTGRVFVDHLYVGCSYLSWSDDEGDTWTTNPAACGLPLNDHQKIGGGAHFQPTPVYDGIVYYSFMHIHDVLTGDPYGGIWVSRSLDGGLSWTSSLAFHGSQGFHYLEDGHVTADRIGTVYVPAYLSVHPPPGGEFIDGSFAVSVSRDYGVTFTPMHLGPANRIEDVDPGLAVDADNNAYIAFLDADGVHVTHTTDQGRSWSDLRTVSPTGLKSFVLGDATAGDPGRVAVAYAASADSDRGPHQVDGWARWHLYVTMTENALAEDPVWVTAQVTPPDEPMQIGTICMFYIQCPGGGDRNLGDFLDVQATPDGRVVVAYVDGCPDGCTTHQESADGRGVIGIQKEGPRLFETRAPWSTR